MPVTRQSTRPALWRRAVTAAAAVALAGAYLLAVDAAPALGTPPGIPSKSTAQSQLNALTVRAEGSLTGYSRDLFPH